MKSILLIALIAIVAIGAIQTADAVTATAKQPNLTAQEHAILDSIDPGLQKVKVAVYKAENPTLTKVDLSGENSLLDLKFDLIEEIPIDAHTQAVIEYYEEGVIPLTAEMAVYSVNQTVTLDAPVLEDLTDCGRYVDTSRLGHFTICLFAHPPIPNNFNNIKVGTWNGCEEGYERDFDTSECKLPEVIAEEALEACKVDPTCPVGIFDAGVDGKAPVATPEPVFRTATDQLKAEIYENMIGMACYRGQSASTVDGIQEKTSYGVPSIEVPDYDLIDGVLVPNGKTRIVIDTTGFTNENLKDPKVAIPLKSVEECIAQSIALDPQGGIFSTQDTMYNKCDYGDFANSIESNMAGCGTIPEIYYQEVEKRSVFSQDFVNADQNRNTNWDDMTRLGNDPNCDSDRYSLGHRISYGCPDVYGTPLQYNGTNTNPEPIFDPTQTPEYKEYIACKVYNNCSDQENKVREQNLDSRIQELLKQLEIARAQKAGQ